MKKFLAGVIVGVMLTSGGVFASSAYHSRYANHDTDDLAEDLHDLLDRECATTLDLMTWCTD